MASIDGRGRRFHDLLITATEFSMTPPKELRREIANLPEVNRANLDPDITRFICHQLEATVQVFGQVQMPNPDPSQADQEPMQIIGCTIERRKGKKITIQSRPHYPNP